METIYRRSNDRQPLSNQEIYGIVRQLYGCDLGFPTDEEEMQFFESPPSKTHCNHAFESSLKSEQNINSEHIKSNKMSPVVDMMRKDEFDAKISQNESHDRQIKSTIFVNENSQSPILSESKTEKLLNSGEDQSNEMLLSSSIAEQNIKSLGCGKNESSRNLTPSTSSIFSSSHSSSVQASHLNDSRDQNKKSATNKAPSAVETAVASEISKKNQIIEKDSPEQSHLSSSRPSGDQLNDLDSLSASCRCINHQGTMMLEKILPFSVDHLFKMMFLDQNFLRYLHKTRETIGFKFQPWKSFNEQNQPLIPFPEGHDLENFEYRSMKYRMKINGMPLVKSVMVFENQYILQNHPERAYCLVSQVKNQGVPYCDSFVASSTWCLSSYWPTQSEISAFTKNEKDKKSKTERKIEEKQNNFTKLVIHFDVQYVKNSLSLSLMKSSIEKSSRQGFQDYLEDVLRLLEHRNLTNLLTKINRVSLSKCNQIDFNNTSDELDAVEDDSAKSNSKMHKFDDDEDLLSSFTSEDSDGINESATNSLMTSLLNLANFRIPLLSTLLGLSNDSWLLKLTFLMLIIMVFINWKLLVTINEIEEQFNAFKSFIENENQFDALTKKTTTTTITNPYTVSQ